MAVNVLLPFASGKFVAANVVSAYSTAFNVFTITFVAAAVVAPATVNLPLLAAVVSSFKLFTLKVCTSALFVR